MKFNKIIMIVLSCLCVGETRVMESPVMRRSSESLGDSRRGSLHKSELEFAQTSLHDGSKDAGDASQSRFNRFKKYISSKVQTVGNFFKKPGEQATDSTSSTSSESKKSSKVIEKLKAAGSIAARPFKALAEIPGKMKNAWKERRKKEETSVNVEEDTESTTVVLAKSRNPFKALAKIPGKMKNAWEIRRGTKETIKETTKETQSESAPTDEVSKIISESTV